MSNLFKCCTESHGQKLNNSCLAEKTKWHFSHLVNILTCKLSGIVLSSYNPSLCKNWSFWTHVTLLTTSCLHHLVMSSYWSANNKGICFIAFQNLELSFCLQGCNSQIAQVKYQGYNQTQTQYTRILDYKTFIDTYNCIGHRLELKYFLFAQFCSMLIKQLIDLRKVRSANLKFRTDLFTWENKSVSTAQNL